MASIRVNGVQQSEPAGATWGSVIDALDAHLAGGDQIVMAVRFDGLDEAAFRDPDVLARPLGQVSLVEIETGTSADLVGRCVDEVTTSLVSLRADVARTGEEFRRFDVGVANASLADVATKLTSLTSIVQAIALALRVNLEDVPSRTDSAAAMVNELSGFLDTIIAAQQAQDWIGVADSVEYDLLPALERWGRMLQALAGLATPEQYEKAS
ncbi:MAG TPA: hypothetical protein VEA16_21285 [Vicinamibacterales bacterium]|nr:hypothetical protein [Vicinamibacterales bacterium]